jgi:Alw26I/Eco31I/Esp3I family type II restriction m6 adenine DNA methyltransferase
MQILLGRYTPSHVVRYIVEKSVGPLIANKTPEQIQRIRIIDPACGSGTFLIAALEKLSQACIEYYLANPEQHNPRSVYKDHNGDLRLTSEFKKRLAVNCIYGVDIDPQAVEVAEMSLYLKILEGETKSSLRTQKTLFPDETFLPDLSRNLKVGNSLVQTDVRKLLPDDDVDSVRPLSWSEAFPEIMRRGGFDAVIGNPPYDVLEKERREASWPHDIFREYLDKVSRLDAAKGGKLNLFRFFLVQALQLARPTGRIGMIVPMSILADISCKQTRLAFLESVDALDVDAFPQKDNKNYRIFYEAKLSTTILTCAKREPSRNKPNPKISLRVFPRNSFMDNPKFAELTRSELSTLDPEVMPIPICEQKAWELAQRLHRSNAVIRLGGLEGITVTRGEINQTVYRKYITKDPNHMRLLKGVEVGPYRIHSTLSQGELEWFDVEKFRKSHDMPAQVSVRRIATQRITGVDEKKRVVATMAGPNWFFADSTNSVVVTEACTYAPEYILALLNSALFQWRFKISSTNNNVGTNELVGLPVRLIELDDRSDKESYNLIVSSAKAALRSGKRAEEAISERAREAAEGTLVEAVRAIDEEISKLYALTDEDVQVVQSASIVPDVAPLGGAAWAVPIWD